MERLGKPPDGLSDESSDHDDRSYFRRKKSQLMPRTLKNIVLYFIFMSMGTSLVASNTIVSLYLKHYSNPSHRDITGDCCDFCDVGSLRPCDNEITLCIGDIESESGQCSFFHKEIYHKYRDEFDFPTVLRDNTRNPILINITHYKGSFVLIMKIIDDDDFSDDDVVDNYNKEIYITPSRSAHSAPTHSYTLSGPGYSQTTIEVEVYCDINFYGTACTVKCVAFDTDDDGHYTCDPSTGNKVCLPGYDGTLCKIDINECESAPCQNGGSCRDHRNYFTCECGEGTSGERCEINIDECASEPCQHRSSCIDQINGYQCRCADGYTGPTCSINVDECASAPCENNATCVDQVNHYTCECPPGYGGSQCESNATGSMLLTSLLIAIGALIVITLLIFTLIRLLNCTRNCSTVPSRRHDLVLISAAYINENDGYVTNLSP